MIERTEIQFRCPLCNKGFKTKNIRGHLKDNHPGITKTEFLVILKNAEATGTQVVTKTRVVVEGVDPSHKTAFSSGAVGKPNFVTLLPGGAPGLGKKKS